MFYVQISSVSNFPNQSNSVAIKTLSSIQEDRVAENICASTRLNSPINKYLVNIAKTENNRTSTSPASTSNSLCLTQGSDHATEAFSTLERSSAQSNMDFSSPDTLSSFDCFLSMEDDKDFVPTITIPASLVPRNDYNSTTEKLHLKKEDAHSVGGKTFQMGIR